MNNNFIVDPYEQFSIEKNLNHGNIPVIDVKKRGPGGKA